MENLYETTVERYRNYVMPTYAPKILFTRGQGARLWDADNREYLDFASGISVCNLGHCNPRVTEAIREQAGKLVHVSNLYMNEMMPRLAEKLITSGMDGVVFFCNSGAEANEGMSKFARKYGNATGRNEIISMDNSFHGRTLATLAETGRAKYRKGFEPEVPGFKQVPFNDFAALEAAVSANTCAILLEPVQGEGGILPADAEYLKKVRALCDEKDILLILDEIQCGMGRTGYWYAWQKYGIKPDIMTTAKALGCGVPVGAFLMTEKVGQHSLTAGDHGTTYGGNPLACAAVAKVLELFEENNILEHVREVSAYLEEKLDSLAAKYDFITDRRGMGLMQGLVFDRPVAPVINAALENGLILINAGTNIIRFVPPLVITDADVDEMIEILDSCLKTLQEQNA